MRTQVLTTKLFVPPPRPNALRRTRLLARLDAGLHHKLTLISAPAGFGKTNLVSTWLAEHKRPAAWLSLDSADANPLRFLVHVVAALQTLAPTLGADLLDLLQSSPAPPIDALLPLLLNEIATLPQPAILVLDDYHLLNAQPIDEVVTFLIEQLPPQLHLVITTREDPALPLARLRARAQLTELRAADLRFTSAEATAFFTEVMGLHLAASDIATLEARTEGWIAGLQLAALSLQGHEDVSGFIRAFAGDHRYILEYLVEEVLQRQPEAVRRFLLQTAILKRLSGPLCDAVTGQEQGSARLVALQRSNFFIVPLDDQRQWYRYHHLFADVLLTQLLAEQPDHVPTLHRRASAWYAEHGALDDAIRHGLAAEDFARAADLIELAVPTLRRNRQEATLLDWLKALPVELISTRPVLSVHYAGTLLAVGELAGVEDRLRAAERWLQPAGSDKESEGQAAVAIVQDTAEFRQLPVLIAVYRAAYALALGDLSGTVSYAQQGLERLDEDEAVMRGAASGLLGRASWAGGDLAAAHRSFADGMASLHKAGYVADTINGAITLATIRTTQGRLRDAMRTYERGFQLAMAHDPPLLRGAADMRVGMSELLREQNALPAAKEHLLQSQHMDEPMGLWQNRYRWYVAMARILEAQGDLDGALKLLDKAERLYVDDFAPNVRPIGALKARVWLAQGRLPDALDWVQEQGLSTNDTLTYVQEFAHITLARVLLARAKSAHTEPILPEAIALLQRLLQAAEAGARTGSVIEVLLLLALAYQLQGDVPGALVPLARALALAEPEGYVRLFIDEGPAMAILLEAQRATHKAQLNPLRSYCERLLSAFDQPGAPEAGSEPTILGATLVERSTALQEPLSERERDVLRLLRTELSGPEIARTLVVSLNTLRTHTKNIYAKLGVSNRRAAVRRAQELDLP
jgi:LuxR family transcriptional regulator, maltose regulon positive regulatory protein